jgi:hypothetical protein
MKSFDIGGSGLARAAYVLLGAFAFGACGGDSTTGPPGGGGTTEQWVTAVTRGWSVPPGTEEYVCHTELVTSDKYYTGFRLASPPAGQTELYVTMRPSVSQVGDFECASSELPGGELIYAAGPGTTPLTFTGGKGVHVAAGQYIELVDHINNKSASPVTATTTIEGRSVAAKDVTTPMDMFFVGRVEFEIPADPDTTTSNSSCRTSADMHVVAEIPLLRSLGVHQTFTVKDPDDVTHTIFDSSFDPQHVTFTSLGTDLLVAGGSQAFASCSWVNTTGVVVNLGESASDESCLLGLYRYPPKPPTGNSPLECAMGISI